MYLLIDEKYEQSDLQNNSDPIMWKIFVIKSLFT